MSAHTCHTKGCTTHCKPEFLMCPRHWRMVPRAMQSAVYRAYRDGQCNLDPLPSHEWFDAAHAAIAHVAKAEGREFSYWSFAQDCRVSTSGGAGS